MADRNENLFKKAERRQAFLKLAIMGPSGSGKTYSALAIASGIGKRIAVIDTENHSASLYADRFHFDTAEVEPPYTIQKYGDAIKAAVSAGYEVLIIDSISHAWAGEGGLLQQKEELDARGGKGEKNQFGNWRGITKQHEKFKAWLLSANIHLICTMRSKQDYVLGEDNKPVKVGMAPIQREGMEYEFTTVLDLAMNHTAQATKDRTSLFDSKIFQPSTETGEHLMKWLKEGIETPKGGPLPLAEITEEDRATFLAVQKAAGWSKERVTEFIRGHFGVERLSLLKRNQFNELLTEIRSKEQTDPTEGVFDESPEARAAQAIDNPELRI